jgi:hypothetical protein
VEAANDSPYDLSLMWNILIDEYNVPENTLKLMTTVNGYSSETLHNLLYAVAGGTVHLCV